MFDIAITTRDNPEWIKPYLISYKKYTSNPYAYTLNIVDTSTKENKLILIDILQSFSDLNINLYYGNRDIHYHETWIESINKSDKNYVLLTHVDIIYLMKNWDLFLIDQIINNKNLISVSVRSKIYPESVWICGEKALLSESGFDHYTINDKQVEHGKIKVLHDLTNKDSLYIADVRPVAKYGDIALVNDEEFIYHNYYSGRIKKDNQCPVPLGSETSYLEQREDFNKTILILEKYLLTKNSLYEYLKNGQF